MVSRPGRTAVGSANVNPAKRLVRGLPAKSAKADLPMKSVLAFLNAQPKPASNGVSLGVMSDDRAL